jgi:hypothetical protein
MSCWAMLLVLFVAKTWRIISLWIKELASGCGGQL